MNTHRHPRPTTRESLTHNFAVNGHNGYLTIGFHDDGSPGEVQITLNGETAELAAMMQAFCMAFSQALQNGQPLDETVARFKGMRFDPMGATNNPDIPEVGSVIDYAARFVEMHFVDEWAVKS